MLAQAAIITSRANNWYRNGLFGAEGPMNGAGMRRLLAYDDNALARERSAFISDWNTLMRLAIIILLSICGSFVNALLVSSFFIETSYKRIGNIYLACAGLADLVITSMVMPTAAVVLLSGFWSKTTVCYLLQFTTQSSIYCYTFLYIMVALENYIRICTTRANYLIFIGTPVYYICLWLFIIGITISGVGVYYKLDVDYCDTNNTGNYYWQLAIAFLAQAAPFCLTVVMLITTAVVVGARARRLARYRRSYLYKHDSRFSNLNLCCYLVFVGAWVPYLVIVNVYPDLVDANYYICVWIGLARSIVTSFIYSGLNQDLRGAVRQFIRYYCCCKRTLPSPYNNRHHALFFKGIGDVRVHMHILNIAERREWSGDAGSLREYETEL